MKKNKKITLEQKSIILFFLGFTLFLFTRRSELVPTISIAIIIAPIFILRFIRTQSTKKGILLTLLGFVLSINIALWGLFKMDDLLFRILYDLIRSSSLAVLYFLPYMIDRLIYPKFKEKNIASTLIFPITTTAIFFLSSLEGPFDGAGMSSKFMGGFELLSLTQMLSVFGIWIFVFISSWLVSTINYSWENKFNWKKIKKIVLIFLSVIFIIFLFGFAKINLTPQSDTVKVAAIILIPLDGEPTTMNNLWEEKSYSPYEETIFRIENLTKTAATNDAKIISFQEHAITINEKDQQKIRKDYQRIAKENNIYLSITYSYYSEDEKGENKHLLIDNKGEIKLDYSKRFLLGLGPFGETGVFKKGPEIIQSVNTLHGKIGISICRDMDFLSFIRQAGKANVDIMLSPSYDWPKSIGPGYSFRTIENGFSFIRPTYNGYSYAMDYNGNLLAHMDSDETKTGIMYANIPTKGVKTIYSKIGDLFAWLCVLGLIAIIIGLFLNRK